MRELLFVDVCMFCGAEVDWVHSLDPEGARFRVFGKGHTFGDTVGLCDRCEQLYRGRDDDELVRLQVAHEHVGPDQIAETVRTPLTVLRNADLGAVTLDETLPPGAAALRAEGFVPVDFLTGDLIVGALWPPEHSRSVPDPRPECQDASWADETAGRFWLVRSPWPGVTTQEVFELLWRWVEPRERRDSSDEAGRRRLITQFLTQTTEDVVAFRATVGD